jgi:hypothetical protein
MKKLVKLSLAASIALGSISPALAFNLGSATNMAGAVAGSALGENSLVTNLMSSLDVTPTQAAGGTAAIMDKAKGSMDSSSYSSLLSKVPGLSGIMDSPAASAVGGSGSLASQFSSLGMDAGMVQKFMPVIQNYLGEYVSPELVSAFASAVL